MNAMLVAAAAAPMASSDASATILARFASLSRDLIDSDYREHFRVTEKFGTDQLVGPLTHGAERAPADDCWLCPGGDAEFRIALHERLFPDISPVAQLERVLERGERGSIDRSILFVGDSLTLQLYEAARCTLPSKYHDALEYADVQALVDFRKTLARMKRGVVLLNLGLRYGPGEKEELRGRADELVGELERWSSDCGDACVAIVATATTQHFSTARDRVWRGHNSSSPVGVAHIPMGGGCAPLPGPFVQMQRVQPSSPNVWRSEAVSEAVHAAGNHVALVPLHLISQHWWSAMRGAMSNAFPEPKTPTFVDCTHYCLTPYLLQPLWWAVCVAATGDAVGCERE